MLKVNENHLSGHFNKNHGLLPTKIGALALSAVLFSGAITYGFINERNKDQIKEVTADVRRSVYQDNQFVNYIKDNASEYWEDSKKEDPFITDRTLNEVVLLNVDAKKTIDFSFFEDCGKLQQLIIQNAQCLSLENIKVLSSMDAKIYLVFNALEVAKMTGKRLDVRSLQKKGVEILFDSQKDNASELENACLFYFLDGIDGSFVNRSMDLDTFRKINGMLSTLLDKASIEGDLKDEEKILKIVKVVTDYLSYDNSVDSYLRLNASVTDKDIEAKAMYYNEFSLSSIVGGDSEGICANYASLFTALCRIAGIEAHFLEGSTMESGLQHAWTMVKVDGNYYFIDSTSLDADMLYQVYMMRYNTATSDDARSKYENQLKEDVFWSLKTNLLSAANDIDTLTKPLKTDDPIVNYNSDLDGAFVNNQGVDLKLPILIGLGSGVFVMVISSNLERKKESDLSFK